jgi:hypothetical protein
MEQGKPSVPLTHSDLPHQIRYPARSETGAVLDLNGLV